RAHVDQAGRRRDCRVRGCRCSETEKESVMTPKAARTRADAVADTNRIVDRALEVVRTLGEARRAFAQLRAEGFRDLAERGWDEIDRACVFREKSVGHGVIRHEEIRLGRR